MSKVQPLPTRPSRPRTLDERNPLRPGVDITPTVRLLRRIGEGAMGSIWLADHSALKTQVAVKCISGGFPANDDEGLARFRREASTAAQIKSPHITHVLDSGATDEGIPFIVMEYLEGETLGERLQRSGWLRLPQAARIVAHVGKALNSAHSVGVIHRDIKPDNIFLMRTDDGVFCKVLDFGIAKQTRVPSIRGLTEEGEVLGTLEYMSPEQMLHRGEVDLHADLWALGVVAYCTITGRLPFSGSNMGELCLNIVHRRFALPGSYRKDLPPAIDDWFARAFHAEPSERFSGAKQMALAFVAAAEQSGDTLSAELLETGEHPLSFPPHSTPPPSADPPPLAAAPTKKRARAHLPTAPRDGADAQVDREPAAPPPVAEQPQADIEPARPRSSRAKTMMAVVVAMVVVAAVAFGLGRLGSAPAGETTATTSPSLDRAATPPTATETTVSTASTPTPEPTTSAAAPTAAPSRALRQQPPRVRVAPTRPPTATPNPTGGFPVPDDPDF